MKVRNLAIIYVALALVPAIAASVALAGEPKLSLKTPAFLCLKQIVVIDDVKVDNCSPVQKYEFGQKAVVEEGGSGGAGSPEIATARLKVTKTFDGRTLPFYQSLVTGAPLQDLELAVSLEDGSAIKFIFELAVVRELHFEGGVDGIALREHLVFEVGGIQIKFTPLMAK